MFEPRTYRNKFSAKRFKSFEVVHLETNLWIGCDVASFSTQMIGFSLELIKDLRQVFDEYIKHNPGFKLSFLPLLSDPNAHTLIQEMLEISQIANVGPMAGVAGAFAEYTGKRIIEEFSPKELVVENGGDIFFSITNELKLSIYAGNSPLSEKVGVCIEPQHSPLGVCTSAGTVGPSKSFGNADAMMIACKSTTLADAYASFFGNQIKLPTDVAPVIEATSKYPDIISAAAICGDKFGLTGKFKLEVFR
jgi:uncharacterized protein